MTTDSQTDFENRRVATLLSALGKDAIEPALAKLDPTRSTQIQKLVEQLSDQPPEFDETNMVLDDFERFLRFALETVGASSALSELDTESDLEDTAGSIDESDGVPAQLKVFVPSDDAIADLQRLDPIQIAGALADEHPKTIAMILAKIDQSIAAATIDLLPDETQTESFMLLREDIDQPDELVVRVARAAVEKGSLIELTEDGPSDSDQKMAEFLRQLPKSTRTRLLEQLKSQDAESATRLQELLYRFDDILLYDNRSIQKLLGQVETNVLVIALEDVDESLKQRVFENLSKRAVSALNEEMEFKQKSSVDEIKSARDQIAKQIGQLDQEGELNQIA